MYKRNSGGWMKHRAAAGTDEQETAAEGMEQDDGRQGRCN